MVRIYISQDERYPDYWAAEAEEDYGVEVSEEEWQKIKEMDNIRDRLSDLYDKQENFPRQRNK